MTTITKFEQLVVGGCYKNKGTRFGVAANGARTDDLFKGEHFILVEIIPCNNADGKYLNVLTPRLFGRIYCPLLALPTLERIIFNDSP